MQVESFEMYPIRRCLHIRLWPPTGKESRTCVIQLLVFLAILLFSHHPPIDIKYLSQRINSLYKRLLVLTCPHKNVLFHYKPIFRQKWILLGQRTKLIYLHLTMRLCTHNGYLACPASVGCARPQTNTRHPQDAMCATFTMQPVNFVGVLFHRIQQLCLSLTAGGRSF